MNSYYNSSTTDSSNELLTMVDENDNVLGPISRKECHNQEAIPWHRTTHIYIVNSNNELLLTRRSDGKDTAPGQVVISSGGHVRFGEEPVTSAKRELYEELNLDIELKFIKKYKIDYEFEKEFVYVYFGTTDLKPEINTEEVSEVIYIPLEEFKAKYLAGELQFPPGSKDVCDLLLHDDLLNIQVFRDLN